MGPPHAHRDLECHSLKARLETVSWWLERARPDVLLQETQLTHADAPHAVLRGAGYELVHHGEGRWNGGTMTSGLRSG